MFMPTPEEATHFALSDLSELEKWAKEVSVKLPPAGALVSDKNYLESTAIHVIAMSQLEFALKSLKKINRQGDIPYFINRCEFFSQLEKDHLIYFYLTRHPLVHNGGYFDDEFSENVRKFIKQLKVDANPPRNSLSVISPDMMPIFINLIKKLIQNCK